MPWQFTSHQELVVAGYTWRGYGTCEQRGCSRKILWYTNPDRKFVPIDPGTYQLHFVSCAGRARIREDYAKVIEFPSGGHRQSEIEFLPFDSEES